LTNRALFYVALRKLYASLYVHIDFNSRSSKREGLSHRGLSKMPPKYKQRFGHLMSANKRPEYIMALRELHVIKLGQVQESLHPAIHILLMSAVFLHTLRITGCKHILPTEYSGLTLPPSLKHISLPHLQQNIVGAIPDNAQLNSIQIVYDCNSLDELQALGKKWGSTLRQLQFTIHVEPGEEDPSIEEIGEFALNFPHLESLRYGYCDCGSLNEVIFIPFHLVVT
jgi:hypothetical protein